jgi:TP53 regulating kinase-like protein|tara:strand:+ start:1537 stop:2166 length:630 start_codon:yes stop_codon:yes gene_type:complete
MARIIKKGAEANLYQIKWFGRPAISKVRCRKKYRLAKLDRKIRQQRTVKEATIIHKARLSSVSVPIIYHVNPDKGEIIMEMIDGINLNDYLNNDNYNSELFKDIGEMIGKLHSNGIIHGDLTTSNIIIRNNKIYLIDFGLSMFSDRTEDQGVDMKLIKALLQSLHDPIAKKAFKAILQGYRNSIGDNETEEVLKVVKEIERRGRYAKVE